jgi:hypothetical protein
MLPEGSGFLGAIRGGIRAEFVNVALAPEGVRRLACDRPEAKAPFEERARRWTASTFRRSPSELMWTSVSALYFNLLFNPIKTPASTTWVNDNGNRWARTLLCMHPA